MKRPVISLFPTEHHDCLKRMFSDILAFTITEPRLPSPDRDFVSEPYPEISVTDSRDELIRKVRELSGVSEMALLSLYAYRDMEMTSWKPFVKAAIERNPVCHEPLAGRRADEIFAIIGGLKNKSVYDSGRMSQPDEVWNFGRGDGAEKAFLMADALIHNDPEAEILISLGDSTATLNYGGQEFHFVTSKGHTRTIVIRGNNYTTD
ncbi:MAG: hypothetical protein LC630_06275 [Bacteroidales bacterium]|nr:hypothetical protein [Bacteroidales bacterium]